MAFTYFFRDMQTLKLINSVVVPVLRGQRYINVWDAGCAHGPEPYSVAMMLRENMTYMLFRNVRIYATDIDTCDQFGKIITDGVYPDNELKRSPANLREKYFVRADRPNCYQIIDEVRSRVSFVKHDLLALSPVRTGFSLIVCKNVLLHFNAAQRINVIRMFHAALRQGGFLVTENTQKLPVELEGLFQQVTSEGHVFKRVEMGPINVAEGKTNQINMQNESGKYIDEF